MTSPNGGEDWTGGKPHDVIWNVSGGVAPYMVKLYYSTNSGAGYPNTITLNAGSSPYSWTLPTINSNQARVKVLVTDSNSQSAEDTSNADFTIDSTHPEINKVNPPDGDTGMLLNTSIQVGFNEPMAQIATKRAFSISPDPGGLSFSWTGDTMTITHHPLTYSTSYTCTISTQAKDDSDPSNNLTAPYTWQFTAVSAPQLIVDLTSPDGGQDWAGGEAHSVRYAVTGGVSPYTAYLQYSTDGGLNWSDSISISGVGERANTYNWATPSVDSDQVRVMERIRPAIL